MSTATLADFALIYGEGRNAAGQARSLLTATLEALDDWEAPMDERDVELWNRHGLDGPDDEDPTDYDVDTSNQGTRCPECGEYTACAYDAEGRALIHPTNEGDDE